MKVSCDSYTQCYPQVAPLGTALDSCKASSRIWHIRGIEPRFSTFAIGNPFPCRIQHCSEVCSVNLR